MPIRHIIAATDLSEEGEHAVQTARLLGKRLGARVTPVMAHFPLPAGLSGAGIPPTPPAAPAGGMLVEGIPAIEIVRCAEEQAADLIVLSRSTRVSQIPYSLGDTCDAVIRRADVPCLIMPPGQGRFGRLILALDGSQRGMAVLRAARRFRGLTDTALSAVYVEPATETTSAPPPSLFDRRAEAIEEAMGAILHRGEAAPLVRRRGDVVAQIVGDLSTGAGDVLVVGVRRGGPANLEESTGAGRRLLAAAPCAVLTVPL